MRGVTGAVRKGVQFVSELSLRAILAVVRCGDNLADAKAPTPLQTVLSRVSIRSPRADVLWTAQFCPPPVPPHLHAPHPWRRTRPTPIPVPLFRPGRHTAGMRRFLRRNEVFLVSRRQNPVLIYVAASGIRTATTVSTVTTVRTVTIRFKKIKLLFTFIADTVVTVLTVLTVVTVVTITQEVWPDSRFGCAFHIWRTGYKTSPGGEVQNTLFL